jgi:glutamate/tyrosine decarboxylase-like PLP-dependent enzyme
MYDHVFEFKYADTLGVDFHKTGFCPYITSAFVVKDRSKFFNLNPSTSIDLKDMKYGDYNPFYTSLEYSRTGVGPMAALTCLKSLGTNSFCKLVGDLVLATHIFRKRLKDNPHVFMLSDGSEGFATLFLLVPPRYGKLTYSTVFSLTDGQTKEIKDYNTRYGKFVLRECIERKTNFLFTSSRSYTLPGTDIKIGAIKAYPFSIFLTEENAEVLAKEVGESIQRFTDQDGDQACTRDEYFVDMTTAGKK